MGKLKLRDWRIYKDPFWKKEMPSAKSMGKKTQKNGWRLPELDLRCVDVSGTNLSVYDMQYIAFDEHTKWSTDPEKCPKGFDKLEQIIKLGKDPGLGIRALHERGIDGSGLSMAIIDGPLSDHIEYHDSLVYYEEIGCDNPEIPGQMHGSAVASIAVGKTCGVAPKAKLYYFAAENVLPDKNGYSIRNEEGGLVQTAEYRAKALERILEINETLPDREKIQVVSMSWGGQGHAETLHSEDWWKALEKAQKAGLFVLTTASEKEYNLDFNGLGKKAAANPNQSSSYIDKDWGEPVDVDAEKKWILEKEGESRWQELINNRRKSGPILVPMEHRTIASPTGQNEYVHYFSGGASWATPWLAATFLLARQVNPSVTPEHFWELARQTGIFSEKLWGTIIQPEKLIETLQKEKGSATIRKRIQNGSDKTTKDLPRGKGEKNE